MISHQNIISTGQSDVLDYLNEMTPTHLSYLPLPHIFERIIMCIIFFKGGRYGVFNGDVTKIKEDLAI